MDDRELLEMAAKAAGLGEVWYLDGSDTPYIGPRYVMGQPVSYKTFRPLADDGDALRLGASVVMQMQIRKQVGSDRGEVAVTARGNHVVEGYADDCMPAIRRAIVRAAAEIGRSHHGD